MKILVENKKALQSYEVLETFEAGIQLFGFEVSALRKGSGSLRGSYVTILENEAFLKGASIPPLQPNNTPKSYEQDRLRKLLLSKKELNSLIGQTSQKGLTLIPTKIYSTARFIKVEVALARNKTKRDKRESLKKRDAEREMSRTLKEHR